MDSQAGGRLSFDPYPRTTRRTYSQLALQGPKALATLQKLTKTDLGAIKNYWFTYGTVAGVPNVMIARTGYSGEDGFEVYLPADRGDVP